MLVAVVAVSLVIGDISTAVIVGLLVVLNIVLDARQELKARAGVRRTASGRTRNDGRCTGGHNSVQYGLSHRPLDARQASQK